MGEALLLKEKRAATISLHNLEKTDVHKGKGGYCVLQHACLRKTLDDITQWHHQKKSQCGEDEIFRGWRMSKNGNTASVFSAASVLNSLAYLWFRSKTVTQCRERRLALVMGFNRKCGVTSETGRDGGLAGGGSGGVEHKRSCDGRWMQINPFSALTEEPKTPTQQNKYRSPGGRAQRDKSLWNV